MTTAAVHHVNLPALRTPLDAAVLRQWRDLPLAGDSADVLSTAELLELVTKAHDLLVHDHGERP